MTPNNLYYIQDADRPMYVLAESYDHALTKWEKRIRIENNMEGDDYIEPVQGIQFIADYNDIVF